MYNNLLKLKKIKGLTEEVKGRIEKAWIWGLITDEEFKTLMEIVEDTPTEEASV